jgi:hypothetical protein
MTSALKFITDEDFNNRILRGLLRRVPDLDIIRIQDTRFAGVADPVILEWAAKEQRVLLTHDRNTMTKYAYARIQQGKTVAGVLVVPKEGQFAAIIEDILFIAEVATAEEIKNQIQYLPL